MNRLLFFISAAFLWLATGAQMPVEFIRLGVNEGLSQNSIYGIMQDRQGFLWAGTGDGLNRYDGKSIRIFRGKYGDTTGHAFPAKMVTGKILEDSRQRLWFFTSRGLTMLDKRSGHFYQPAAAAGLSPGTYLIGIDSADVLWLIDRGILSFNTRTGKMEQLTRQEEHFYSGLLAQGKVYTSSMHGVWCFDIERHQSKMLVADTSVTNMLLLNNGQLAYTALNSLHIFDLATHADRRIVIHSPGGHSLTFTHMVEYPADILYIGIAIEGLCRVDLTNGQQSFYRNEPGNPISLTSNLITVLYLDRSRNLWIGTEGGGMSRLDLKPQKFKSFPAFSVNSQHASNLMVKSVYVEKNNILIGTFAKGLYVVDTATAQFRHITYPGLKLGTSLSSINVLYKDSAGRMWMNVGGVLGIVDPATFRFRQALHVPDEARKGNLAVYAFCELKKNTFLAGTGYNMFLVHADDRGHLSTSGLEAVPFTNALSGYTQCITQAPDGSIWIGKIGHGFWHVRIDGNRLSVIDSGLLNNDIRCFYFPHNGQRVWMATENGLVAYDVAARKSRIFDEAQGMGNSYVYSIVPECGTACWLSTNKGLSHVQWTEQGGQIADMHFSNYTQTDRLQSNEFNTGAFFKSRNGLMVFGGVNGINWFRPDEIVANRFRPQLALTSIDVNEQPLISDTDYSYIRSVRLPYDHNTLVLKFASLEFTNANANKYAYRLEGYDRGWIEAAGINEARYPNLPPGHYLFRVRATNNDGIWSDQDVALSVVIDPPFWQTWWFRLGVAICIVVALVLVIRYYYAQQLKEKIRLLEKQHAVNAERLRISKDMHDELGTGLTKIALLSEVTRKKLQPLASQAQQLPLQEIFNTSRDLTQRMGEIIWTLNPSNDHLDSLMAYLKEYIHEVCEDLDVTVHANLPGPIPAALTNQQRQQVLMVTKEALHNALKHGHATTIIFSGCVEKNWLRLELRDDGKGFDPLQVQQRTGKRNGLENMRWRMAQAGGSFDIESAKDGGTSVRYGLPLQETGG